MDDNVLDRRKHKLFRIMYIDFRAFWNRYILRKKASQGSPGRKPVAPPPPKSQADHFGHKSFSTGVKKIDQQHQGVRDAILNLQKDMRAGLMGPPLAERLDSLLQQMNEHFRFEEAYLEHIGFPELQHHRAEHDQFRAQLLQFRYRVEASDHTVSLELSSFLFNWFRDHTLQEDSTYSKGHPLR